jgi:mRNA interferase RelE/StbE
VKYRIELKPKAGKDLKELPKAELERVVELLRWLEDDLREDVKFLTNHSPEYRMRAGDYRALLDSHSTIRWIVSKSGVVLTHRHSPPYES